MFVYSAKLTFEAGTAIKAEAITVDTANAANFFSFILKPPVYLDIFVNLYQYFTSICSESIHGF